MLQYQNLRLIFDLRQMLTITVPGRSHTTVTNDSKSCRIDCSRAASQLAIFWFDVRDVVRQNCKKMVGIATRISNHFVSITFAVNILFQLDALSEFR
jgi:hypothetical protein